MTDRPMPLETADNTADIAARKTSLRQNALRLRAGLDRAAENVGIVPSLFLTHFKPSAGSIVTLYAARGDEFPMNGLAADLWQAGVRCALPVVRKGARILEFYEWTPDMVLTQGAFGVNEPPHGEGHAPVLPDFVIVPLLAFDARGQRLGYGGGYYDATLAHLRAQKSVQAIGLAYEAQFMLSLLPAEPHDQPLDAVITPQQVRVFGAQAPDTDRDII